MIGWKTKPEEAVEDSKPKGFDDYDIRLGDLMRGERATLGKSLLDVQREAPVRGCTCPTPRGGRRCDDDKKCSIHVYR